MTVGLLIILILYTLIFTLSEVLHRRGIKARVTRKIAHIGGGIISAFLPLFVNLPTALILGLFFQLS